MPAIVVTFVVGAIAFGALGLAVAAFAPNGDAAVAIANATLLPAAFVSSVFIPLDDPSTLVKVVGSLLPLKPFALAFQDAVHADDVRRFLVVGPVARGHVVGTSPAWSSRCASSRGSHANREPRADTTDGSRRESRPSRRGRHRRCVRSATRTASGRRHSARGGRGSGPSGRRRVSVTREEVATRRSLRYGPTTSMLRFDVW